ncbi:hypothetical protein J6590_042800 [Homalodisca vitripennis]|nr:hypothetical protein J6590_042800 [Homalodisca vitripennis]
MKHMVVCDVGLRLVGDELTEEDEDDPEPQESQDTDSSSTLPGSTTEDLPFDTPLTPTSRPDLRKGAFILQRLNVSTYSLPCPS